MARTARNYRIVHAANLKATRAARRSKARYYKQVFKLPKPMHFVQPSGRPRTLSKSRRPRNPGHFKPRGLRATHSWPVKKRGPRIIKSKIMKRKPRKFNVIY